MASQIDIGILGVMFRDRLLAAMATHFAQFSDVLADFLAELGIDVWLSKSFGTVNINKEKGKTFTPFMCCIHYLKKMKL